LAEAANIFAGLIVRVRVTEALSKGRGKLIKSQKSTIILIRVRSLALFFSLKPRLGLAGEETRRIDNCLGRVEVKS
jgi:hypothetical protein